MRNLTLSTSRLRYLSEQRSPELILQDVGFPDACSLSEKVLHSLVHDLLRLGWSINPDSNTALEIIPPKNYEKYIVKASMAYCRDEIIQNNRPWIDKHLQVAQSNLANGIDALSSRIEPSIEVCTTQEQNDLFRMYRYYWSSPSSDYVGRRIRIIVRDLGLSNKPVIGIAAIGSSIIHIPDRDNWINWDIKTRTSRIIYLMDAYVVGALPPYNELLGGKLMTYILASNELRKIFQEKYKKSMTIISGRKRISDLALIMTTSLYGLNSSQYNRLKYRNSLLCKPIGITSGFGTIHISNVTFMAMRELLVSKGIDISHKFGDGPNWRMRVVRSACDLINLNSEVILKHSFKRGLYAIPLAVNWKSFLNGQTKQLKYLNLPLKKLAGHWRTRWLEMRKQNLDVITKVAKFTPEKFNI